MVEFLERAFQSSLSSDVAFLSIIHSPGRDMSMRSLREFVYGGAAVGKAPTMPANPDLDSKPEVVAELVKYVRGLGQ